MFDLDDDGALDFDDRVIWVDRMESGFGDADLDGQFESGDLNLVFQSGRYSLSPSERTGWAAGDWNGDFRFDSPDLMLAFRDGNYEKTAALAMNVPGSSSFLGFALGLLLLNRW